MPSSLLLVSTPLLMSSLLVLCFSTTSLFEPTAAAGPPARNSFRAQLLSAGQLAIQQQEEEQEKTFTPNKCQRDYLKAMMHRCRVGERVCFADELELEDVQQLASYISEMCCLLRCQPKTLERLCCRSQQGKCRQAKCLSIQELGLLIEGGGDSNRK